MDHVYMQDITLILAELIIAGVIFTAISWIAYEIGKFARALTALEQSVNTLGQALTTHSGYLTSSKDYNIDDIQDR